MSVLKRRELEDSPLADLHAIASELGIEGYRALRREDLVNAILRVQGGQDERAAGSEAAETAPEAADAGSEPALAQPEEPEGERGPVVGLTDEGGSDDVVADEARAVASDGPGAVASDGPGAVASDGPGANDAAPDEAGAPGDAAPDEAGAEAETATGTLDVLPNGSGFIRVSGPAQSNDDVYVAPAQIRRCELRAGDEVSGPIRRPRRSERHRSLVRVAEVNGRDAEPPEERPDFEIFTPVHPTERLPAPAALEAAPFGKGSRVAIAGAPGAGATRLLREVAATLAGADVPLTVVLLGARPEEVTDWTRETGLAVAGGAFDRSLETQIQAAELTMERAKRAVERGGEAVVIIDSLEAVPAGPARRLFGAARKVEEGGSLTVIAAVGSAPEPLRQASTRITLDGAVGDALAVLEQASGTQRADLLG